MTRRLRIPSFLAAVLAAASLLAGAPPSVGQPPSSASTSTVDAFTTGIDQKKFILLFFRDSAAAPNRTTDLMSPVVAGIAREPLIQRHVVFGDIDLARDKVGAGVFRALDAACKQVSCPNKLSAPALSLLLPNSARISEIARLVGRQNDFSIRDLLVERMCDAIQKHNPDAPPMDEDLASACRGLADSRPAKARVGWRRVAPAGAGFSVDMPGVPLEYSRTVDTPSGKLNVGYVTAALDQTNLGVIYTDFAAADGPAPALRAFDGYLSTLGRITSETPTRFHGFSARKFVVRRADGSRISGVVFANRGRLYELLCRGGVGPADPEAADQFLQSFNPSN